VVDQALYILIAAVVAAPIVSGVAYLFELEEGLKEKLKSTPFSFRNAVWYREERKINKKYFVGHFLTVLFTIAIS